MFLQGCLLSLLLGLAGDTLVVYPEYPEEIRRDYAYGVTVTQNETTRDLVVYNHTERSILSGRSHGGDCYRRFCEFAFSGSPVRVDITVRQDISCYKVFPASRRLKSTFRDGVLSVWLDRPVYFGVQFNDDNNTILSLFADAPEDPESIPKKGEPGVLYVDSWLDAPERDGRITTGPEIHEIYIAPGAVLNARLTIKGENTLVHGRGMILDPLSNIFRYDQTKSSLGFLCTAARNVTVRDVKLIDARTFNYIAGSPETKLFNIKAMSSMMCTDGISFWGGPGTVVENAWLYVGDNALVLSGSQPLTIRNVAIGTSCAAIFPQSSFKTPVELENIDVFRCDEGLINNYYNGKETPATKPQTIALHFRNFTAVDATLFPWIFQGRNMGELPKTFVFENASFPESTGASHYLSIGKIGSMFRVTNGPKSLFTKNYTLDFTNLYVAGKRLTSLPDNRITGREWITIHLHEAETTDQIPLFPDRHEVDYRCPNKLFIGDSQQFPAPGDAPFSGIVRRKETRQNENLVAETNPIQSVWQRVPSWMVKLETLKDGDTVIYSLRKIQRHSGMHCNITDGLLRHGNGTYVLTFDARCDAPDPVPLEALLLSNEKSVTQKVPLGKTWQSYRMTFDTNFDPAVTRMVSLWLRFSQPLDDVQFRNIVFTKLP
ncbi:MAG: hypothetical protein Q4D98_12675 [Planctomycetia bacterium]|nr:hypothetical protein [Planctomycetia bacterium]